ncbi:dTDP-glucose 4,6-dehydratase [Methanosarcina horonobensis]|uniref:dTDP-glucose 4,6-dehydratase n=1 Tax=Methanosarcina horonobensis TaxID=418008 RepID=UPI000AE92405|nr:GDP-mannose 4,6-dehydratase [Methanosarcina horonobensis]
MKILVTGGAGFIGSHLCEKYTKNGDTVLCLDNFINGSLTNIRHLLNYRNFKLINGDIQNYDLLEKIMRDVDVVFHLAAQIHVDRSIVEPKLTYDINVLGTQNILEAARIHDVNRVIHASTSEVYGSAKYSPMDEDHQLLAPHPYGASKIAADRMCYAYINTYGMDICIARPFNIYGPRQKDSGYGGAISIFTKRVLSGLPPIIYGDGNQTRDYTFVGDIVRAYDSILNHSNPIKEPVNFGTGAEFRIVDIANKIIQLCDSDLKPVSLSPDLEKFKG